VGLSNLSLLTLYSIPYYAKQQLHKLRKVADSALAIREFHCRHPLGSFVHMYLKSTEENMKIAGQFPL
jgi:hypothetical protein